MKESINLIPQTRKEDILVSTNTARTALVLSVALFLVEGILATLLIARIKMNRDLFLLKSSIDQKGGALALGAEAEGTIRGIQNKLSAIKNLRDGRLSFYRAVTHIPTLIPEDVILNNITLGKEGVEIVARTHSGSSFTKMVENVGRSARFRDLTLTGSTLDEVSGYYTFTFEARVEKGVFK